MCSSDLDSATTCRNRRAATSTSGTRSCCGARSTRPSADSGPTRAAVKSPFWGRPNGPSRTTTCRGSEKPGRSAAGVPGRSDSRSVPALSGPGLLHRGRPLFSRALRGRPAGNTRTTPGPADGNHCGTAALDPPVPSVSGRSERGPGLMACPRSSARFEERHAEWIFCVADLTAFGDESPRVSANTSDVSPRPTGSCNAIAGCRG